MYHHNIREPANLFRMPNYTPPKNITGINIDKKALRKYLFSFAPRYVKLFKCGVFSSSSNNTSKKFPRRAARSSYLICRNFYRRLVHPARLEHRGLRRQVPHEGTARQIRGYPVHRGLRQAEPAAAREKQHQHISLWVGAASKELLLRTSR